MSSHEATVEVSLAFGLTGSILFFKSQIDDLQKLATRHSLWYLQEHIFLMATLSFANCHNFEVSHSKDTKTVCSSKCHKGKVSCGQFSLLLTIQVMSEQDD
jgi:hypothetical protein